MSSRDEMLRHSRNQFLIYESEHRQKAHRFNAERRGCSDEVECGRLQLQENQAIEKANFNKSMAENINGVLNSVTENAVARTAEFGKIVNPEGFTGTSQQSQLGVHFEEIAEMLMTFESSDKKIEKLINEAHAANEKLGNALKQKSNTPSIRIVDRLEFIDAIADQLVTATLSAVQFNMNPVGALIEVNRSNFSKLTDGKMALDPVTNKWIKGPNYFKAYLKPYI